jgi:hypothetical protein
MDDNNSGIGGENVSGTSSHNQALPANIGGDSSNALDTGNNF